MGSGAWRRRGELKFEPVCRRSADRCSKRAAQSVEKGRWQKGTKSGIHNIRGSLKLREIHRPVYPVLLSYGITMAGGNLVLGLCLGLLVYVLGLILFRLFLSPLARVPGPIIAAATGWYEFYWDCLKQGQYVFRIQEMHKKYGKGLSHILYSLI